MKLVYTDSPIIDGLTLRRLILLGSEITLVQRPSIQFEKDFGTVGMPTNIQEVKSIVGGGPIIFNEGIPPGSVFASPFYKTYFDKDLQNPLFIDTVIEGIKQGWFNDWYLDPKQNKNTDEFKDFKGWIVSNQQELQKVDYSSVKMPTEPFKVTNKDEAYFMFKTMLSEESLRVTSVLSIDDQVNGSPLSINPFLDKLVRLRLSNEVYTGKANKSRQLGIRLFEAMIPDEALLRLSFDDLLSFREKTKHHYEAWEIEINKLEAEFLTQGFEFTDADIQLILDKEINPRLYNIKEEIRKTRDELFANIMKIVKNIGISVITGGTLTAINIPTAIAGFIITNLKMPELTDKIIDTHFKIKDIKQSNGLTYLMKINQKIA